MTQEVTATSKNAGGKDFLTTFLQNYQVGYSKGNLQLFISSLSENIATVSIVSHVDKNMQTVTVRPRESVTVNISAEAEMSGTDIFQSAVEVNSDQTITVQALNAKPSSGDLTLLQPLSALGTEYFVVTPIDISSRNVREFAVLAGSEGAEVSVTLKGAVTFKGKSYSAGDVLKVTLNSYESVQLQSRVDLSGSKVTANNPIVVFSGHSCAQKHTKCDFVMEQLLPTSAWGTHYVVPPLSSQSDYDLVYVVASQTTKLTYNQGGDTGSRELQMGDVVELQVKPSQPLALSADVGIQVVLFGTGAQRKGMTYDPYLVLIPDVDAYCPSYVIRSIPNSEDVALVMVKTSDTGGLTMDGHTLGATLTWQTVPGSEFSYAEVDLSSAEPLHTAEATTNFGLLVFGLAQAAGYATAATCSQSE